VIREPTAPNPDTLLNRLDHHAAPAGPLVDACLRNLVLRCPLASDPHEHRLSQRKRGANSFALLLGGGDYRQFHFRALQRERYAVIHVKDSFKGGREVATLRTEGDVRSFFEGLSVPSEVPSHR
jgi:hypothetical protein